MQLELQPRAAGLAIGARAVGRHVAGAVTCEREERGWVGRGAAEGAPQRARSRAAASRSHARSCLPPPGTPCGLSQVPDTSRPPLYAATHLCRWRGGLGSRRGRSATRSRLGVRCRREGGAETSLVAFAMHGARQREEGVAASRERAKRSGAAFSCSPVLLLPACAALARIAPAEPAQKQSRLPSLDHWRQRFTILQVSLDTRRKSLFITLYYSWCLAAVVGMEV